MSSPAKKRCCWLCWTTICRGWSPSCSCPHSPAPAIPSTAFLAFWKATAKKTRSPRAASMAVPSAGSRSKSRQGWYPVQPHRRQLRRVDCGRPLSGSRPRAPAADTRGCVVYVRINSHGRRRHAGAFPSAHGTPSTNLSSDLRTYSISARPHLFDPKPTEPRPPGSGVTNRKRKTK